MNIKVKLFATLRDGRGKELDMVFEDGIDVKRVIAELKLTEADVAILLINGRDGELDAKLQDGDVISIFPPVGGG